MRLKKSGTTKATIYVIGAALCILSAGCTGISYYDLYIEPEKPVTVNRIERILQIDDIQSREPYINQGIVYRSDPFRLEVFPFKRWAKLPGDIITDAVTLFFRNSGIFRRVIEPYSSAEADLLLKIRIYALEMSRNQGEWYARLSLDLEISDPREETVLATHSFDRREKMPGKKAVFLPPQISRILREELLVLREKITTALNSPSNP